MRHDNRYLFSKTAGTLPEELICTEIFEHVFKTKQVHLMHYHIIFSLSVGMKQSHRHIPLTKSITAFKAMEEDTHWTLSMLERDFLISLHVAAFHLPHDLPRYLHLIWTYICQLDASLRALQFLGNIACQISMLRRGHCNWDVSSVWMGQLLTWSWRPPDSAVLLPDNSNDTDHTAGDPPVNWTHLITSNNTIEMDLLNMTSCVWGTNFRKWKLDVNIS